LLIIFVELLKSKRRPKMTVWFPIQADLEGLYYDIPKTLTSMRKGKRSAEIVEEIERNKRELIERAKKGDRFAIYLLKKKYKIKSFVHRGKKII